MCVDDHIWLKEQSHQLDCIVSQMEISVSVAFSYRIIWVSTLNRLLKNLMQMFYCISYNTEPKDFILPKYTPV